ncbi:MAG: hypothetical protein JKY56_23645 [Kofleriaceae bacterium]|nr:hypothetical protein [Kofleriaceae bacterium]
MSVTTVEALLSLVEGDQELLDVLESLEVITKDALGYSPDQVEAVLVSRTLVRELEVNWAGVEVILRMRQQLLCARLRLAELHTSDKEKG